MHDTEMIRAQALQQINGEMINQALAWVFGGTPGERPYFQIHKNINKLESFRDLFGPVPGATSVDNALCLSGEVLHNGDNPTAPRQTYIYMVDFYPYRHTSIAVNIYTEKKLFGLFWVKEPLPAPYPLDLLHQVLRDADARVREAHEESLRYDKRCKNEYDALQSRLQEIRDTYKE